jgi:subfamily B ATP-binding cassette protein HlyB/CyaB
MSPHALIALELIAHVHQIPIVLQTAEREFAIVNEYVEPALLVRIARSKGFKARLKRNIAPEKFIQHYPLPAITYRTDGTCSVALKMDPTSRKVLCFDPVDKTTAMLAVCELPNTWVVLTPKRFDPKVKFGFQWFYQEILLYKQVIAEVLLGSFTVQLFALATPMLTQVVLDKVIVHRSVTTLDVMGIAFISIMIFELLLNLARNYIFTHTANKIDAKLGVKLFKHLFSLPLSYFESRPVGFIISSIRELDSIRTFITSRLTSVIIDTLFAMLFFIVMTFYSLPLTLIVAGSVIFIGITYFILTPLFRSSLETKFQHQANSNSYLVESVTGIQTVKSLSLEGIMQRNWEEKLGDFLYASFRLSNIANIANAFTGTFQRLMMLAVLYFGVRFVIDSQMSIGQLIAFNMLAGQLISPVIRLAGIWNEFQQALLGVKRLGDILNHPTEIQSSETTTGNFQLQGGIRANDLSFRYQPSQPCVLQKVSFVIPPETSVALVGRSGSGKSTIAKLIQRLYYPTEGNILFDGVDSRQIDPAWLRYQIGVVLQENYLFSGTICENIKLPRPNASMEEVIHAAKLAGAHEFITQLSNGYDTPVGERGSSLSGGQKQRIAIARALINNPKILIFDEATSALDYESEQIINDNMPLIRQGRTVIMIAHRLSTIRQCDSIIAFDQGQIVEAGTHDELIARQGYYYTLVQQSIPKGDIHV